MLALLVPSTASAATVPHHSNTEKWPSQAQSPTLTGLRRIRSPDTPISRMEALRLGRAGNVWKIQAGIRCSDAKSSLPRMCPCLPSFL